MSDDLALFVVVRRDRHIDDEITLHRTEQSAMTAVEKFRRQYDEYGATWESEPIDGWHFYARTDHDDGPSVHVEIIEVEP